MLIDLWMKNLIDIRMFTVNRLRQNVFISARTQMRERDRDRDRDRDRERDRQTEEEKRECGKNRKSF